MFLFALLPVASLFLASSIFYFHFHSRVATMAGRKAIICSILCISLFVVAVTEALNCFRQIAFPAVLICWSLLTMVLAIMAFIQRRWWLLRAGLAGFLQRVVRHRLALAIGSMLLLSLAVALVYPPNNFDSMTYHMARVAHWMQDASIDHYRTHILRQIQFPPLAEWVILHLQILTGGDLFANAVQLVYFVGGIGVVSMIAAQLGANRPQQLLSAFVCCCIPIALLESNTTQNDIVVSFYLLCFVYACLLLTQSFSGRRVLLAGLSLGFAWLTKGTGYLFSLPFCIWMIVIALRAVRISPRALAGRFAGGIAVALIAVAINAGHYQRNIFLSGSPMANSGEGTVIEGSDPRQIVLIGLKNLMNHLPSSLRLRHGVESVARRAGVDPDDPKYSLVSMNDMVGKLSFHEDYAQNFFHVLLIFWLTARFLFNRPARRSLGTLFSWFFVTLWVTAILFCTLLQWQPWANRLETPLFLLFSVCIGMDLYRIRPRFRRVIVFGLGGYAALTLLLSARHPILPVTQSIITQPYNEFIYTPDMLEMAQYVQSTAATTIGLYIGLDSWDYIYFKLLASGSQHRIIRHVFVQNPSTIYLEDFLPDLIISMETSVPSYYLSGQCYRQVRSFGHYAIFRR